MKTTLYVAGLTIALSGCVMPPVAPQDISMQVGPDTFLIELESFQPQAKRQAVEAANKKCKVLQREILVLDVKDLGDPKRMPAKVEVMFRCLPAGHADLKQEPLQRTHAHEVVPGKTVIAPNITNNSSGK